MPLGLYPNRKYNQATIKLKPGDSIILFSDGITEQQNSGNKHFGVNRFKKILQKSMSIESKVLIEKLEKKLNRFKVEMPQNDDITIMMLKFNHKKRPE